jgi:1,4-alpha-glucan branching enzyme
VLRPRSEGGAGFDAVLGSDLREAVRGVLAQAARGASSPLQREGVARALYPRHGASWRTVHALENHDLVRINNEVDRQPRIASLAGGGNARSWYARSRARVANGLLLTAPGIPSLFMGQEFLEDKYWSDDPEHFTSTLIYWDGLRSDRVMQDHLRFVRDLIALRRRLDGLRGDGINVFHAQDDTRVLAFHRWVEGRGADVVIVVSLSEGNYYGYELGFPGGGQWQKAFNSDAYDNWINPAVAGNEGAVRADGPPMHGLPCSARLVIPANSVLVFAR